mmetsp:Transcript_253/g.431  ORF Transcript_253/g.431 Transcript_253/m.431 type:complete len:616 (-) Transcript_253:76-1923(-)
MAPPVYGGTKSHSKRDCTLMILNSPDDTITFVIEVTTKVSEVKELLKQKLGVESHFSFVTKQSSSYRTLNDQEEMRSKVTVKGLKSFVRERARYDYPLCVIGAGHMGLRQALDFQKRGYDYVVYDRLNQIGGVAWVKNANPTSKLQTELGSYHLQFDLGVKVPKMPTWPSRDDLLIHFKEVCDEYGMTPNIRLNTDVTGIEIIDDKKMDKYDPKAAFFSLISEKTDGSSEDEEINLHSTIAIYPGGLTKNKRIEYKGEDVFDGQIGYGMFSEFDYTKVAGDVVTVIGMGAFGVENVRTCLEHDAEKCYILCRRKNITLPRVVDYWINGCLYPPPAAMMLDFCKKMYDMIPDDPWSYYAVMANKDQTTATIRQNSRFGIGDAYYLATYYGKCEVILDQVKRLKPDRILTEGGDAIECQHMIKVIGFVGDFTVEKVLGVKEMVGYHVNGDWRRWACSEAPGIDAGKFGGTSLSTGAISNSWTCTYFYNFPKDYHLIADSGMMPRKKPSEERASYVWDPRANGSIGMIYGSGLVPGIVEEQSRLQGVGREKMWQAHPWEDYIQECAADWLNYCELFKKNGDDRPFPEYPYTLEDLRWWTNLNDTQGKEELDKLMGMSP